MGMVDTNRAVDKCSRRVCDRKRFALLGGATCSSALDGVAARFHAPDSARRSLFRWLSGGAQFSAAGYSMTLVFRPSATLRKVDRRTLNHVRKRLRRQRRHGLAFLADLFVQPELEVAHEESCRFWDVRPVRRLVPPFSLKWLSANALVRGVKRAVTTRRRPCLQYPNRAATLLLTLMFGKK